MMYRINIVVAWILLAAWAMLAAGCSRTAAAPTPAPSSVPPSGGSAGANSADPFAYCAAVGTVDKPDSRYTGAPVPDQIISGFKRAAGLEASTEPIDAFRKTTIWRCMQGKVYVCNFGANLPCDSKANVDKTPSPALTDYCTAQPNSDFIPMSATGHDTIYSWHCVHEKPEVLEQIGQVDAQGYLAQIWYAVSPGR